MRTASASPRLISDNEFTAWLLRADAGERLTYWRGHLAIDASPLASQLRGEDRIHLGRLSGLAWEMAAKGWIHLLQQRHGPSDFSYVAIVRPRVQVPTRELPRTPTKVAA